MDLFSANPTVMTFYSDPADVYSHRCRIVLAEKSVGVDIVDTDMEEIKETLWTLNPYGVGPTLVDRDLVIYEANIIAEYLDERYPHPPLLPVYPIQKAQSRLMIYRIDKDWYPLLPQLDSEDAKLKQKAKKELVEGLISISPIFEERQFFLEDEFSLVDCVLAPLLWRLPEYNIQLPKREAKYLLEYAERIFERPSFKASLSRLELEMKRLVEA